MYSSQTMTPIKKSGRRTATAVPHPGRLSSFGVGCGVGIPVGMGVGIPVGMGVGLGVAVGDGVGTDDGAQVCVPL